MDYLVVFSGLSVLLLLVGLYFAFFKKKVSSTFSTSIDIPKDLRNVVRFGGVKGKEYASVPVHATKKNGFYSIILNDGTKLHGLTNDDIKILNPIDVLLGVGVAYCRVDATNEVKAWGQLVDYSGISEFNRAKIKESIYSDLFEASDTIKKLTSNANLRKQSTDELIENRLEQGD